MLKRWIAPLLAVMAGVGALWAFIQRQNKPKTVITEQLVEDAPISGLSLSAQPHKRVRVAQPPAPELKDRPAPDSAEEGRTPYYFVPGEALLTLYSEALIAEAFFPTVAARFGAVWQPIQGQAAVSYPAADQPGYFTIVRLRWEEDADYEESLSLFRTVEATVNEDVRWDTCRVATWMPNWLGTVASTPTEPRMFTPGGAGAYPRPMLTPTTPHLPLKETGFLDKWRSKATKPVTLAIVDAFPDPGDFTDAMVFPPSLHAFTNKVKASPTTLSLDASQHYATFREGEPYEMESHGIMTAWLAAEIIGEKALATIALEPIRIAGKTGVCSIADVIAALAPLAQRARDGENIVALMAFVMGMGDIIPPRLRPYEEHYEGLRLVCLSISEAGGILIGASGNDATGLQHPPRTRIPSKFRSVIEVSAGQLYQSKLALYANQAKALCLFGGEADLRNLMVDNIAQLVGPVLPTANTPSGWVAWAGTSFAAAMAAGLAVLLKADRPALKMWDIRTELRAVATSARNPGNVPFIDIVEEYQFISADDIA